MNIFILEDNASIQGLYRYERLVEKQLHHYSLARTFMDALDVIRNSAPFDEWSLDHDLGDHDGNGLDFLKLVADRHAEKWPVGKVHIHSNHSGHALDMREFIEKFEDAFKKNQAAEFMAKVYKAAP